jgi:LysR family transcriptional activator of nhaA
LAARPEPHCPTSPKPGALRRSAPLTRRNSTFSGIIVNAKHSGVLPRKDDAGHLDNQYGERVRTLNFNHLHYFWVVARLGSVTKASRELRVTQPTLSTQIRQLERELGRTLFTRTGREMMLTPAGRLVLGYADQMFRACEGMVQALAEDESADGTVSLNIGAANSVPKLIVRRMLEPLRALKPAVRFVCTERRTERLMEDLRLHRLDVVLTDAPVPSWPDLPVVTAVAGESDIGFYASAALAAKYRAGFPSSLSGAPFVLPLNGTGLRERLQAWFTSHQVRPVIAAEVEDRAMLNYMGQAGFGVVPAASLLGPDIREQYGLELIGSADGVRDQYSITTLSQHLKHPAVEAIFASARRAAAGEPARPRVVARR